MTQDHRITDELSDLQPAEVERIEETAARLAVERPLPRPMFKARLRRKLSNMAAQPGATRPERLRLLVSAYVGSGLVLLAIAATGVAGAGPLGY